MKSGLAVIFCSMCFGLTVTGQQVPDTLFTYLNQTPTYKFGTGPKVLIDEGHHNFHTVDGRYGAFAKLLREDGYIVEGSADSTLTKESFVGCDVFVIANPLNELNYRGDWRLPTPSAYTKDEIQAISSWVFEGGSLFLIADHMPFAGAAADLASAFGVRYLNGFAMDNQSRTVEKFYCSNGLACDMKIDTVVTFTGSAFSIDGNHRTMIELSDQYTVFMPEVAWTFEDDTPSVSGEGLLQVAGMEFGKGRLVISGEAAMFSAQLAGPTQMPIGFNAPQAPENCAFLLMLMKYLSGK